MKVPQKTDNCFALSKMAHTKQTVRKQLTPGMQTQQVEVSTSEEEQEEPMAKKKPRSKARKREADSSGVTAEEPKSPPKKKKVAQKKKGETATTSTTEQKGKPAAKKRAPTMPKGKATPTSAEGGQKAKKERYICPRYTDDMEPPKNVPPPQDRKRKVVVEYSTDEEVGEALIDASIKEGEYAPFDIHPIKRIKKSVKLTLPPDSKATPYPETFIVWYQEHGMTAGMRVALRGIGRSEEDIDAFKDRFIRQYGITAGYKLRYPGEALSEDDEPGKGGLADLIADAPPQTEIPGTSQTGTDPNRLRKQIQTARAAMAQRETQARVAQGTKRKTRPSEAPPPKKTWKSSAALGRAPSEEGAGTSSTPMTTVLGQTVAPKVLEADQLEDYLVGRKVQTPKAMPALPPTTGQEDVALTIMGGFLDELRGRVPKGGQRGTVVSTPIPRRSADKWKPVLGKPTVPTAATIREYMDRMNALEVYMEPFDAMTESNEEYPGPHSE